MRDLAAAGRVLVGWDFCFGLPAGTAAAAGLVDGGAPPWRALWDWLADHVVDGPGNANNRFAVAAALNARVGPGPGPFWGCPPAQAAAHLSPRRAPGFPHQPAGGGPALDERRTCERLWDRTARRPSSPWQLLGVGSVGGQSLLGMAALARLVAGRPAATTAVWPFTTGLGPDPTGGRADVVVLAEVWPSAVALPVYGPAGGPPVRDAAQVTATAVDLAEAAADGRLAARFDPPRAQPRRRAVLDEEGWIL